MFFITSCKNNAENSTNGKSEEATLSPDEDFEYKLSNGKCTITKYIGTALEAVIPERIKEHPVTKIGSKAFNNYDMDSVFTPDSVLTIK